MSLTLGFWVAECIIFKKDPLFNFRLLSLAFVLGHTTEPQIARDGCDSSEKLGCDGRSTECKCTLHVCERLNGKREVVDGTQKNDINQINQFTTWLSSYNFVLEWGRGQTETGTVHPNPGFSYFFNFMLA